LTYGASELAWIAADINASFLLAQQSACAQMHLVNGPWPVVHRPT
jgi:hypothetical protein